MNWKVVLMVKKEHLDWKVQGSNIGLSYSIHGNDVRASVGLAVGL